MFRILRKWASNFQLTESWQRDWNFPPFLPLVGDVRLSTDRILATGLKHPTTTERIEDYLLSTDRILATGLKRTKMLVRLSSLAFFQLTESWQRDWNIEELRDRTHSKLSTDRILATGLKRGIGWLNGFYWHPFNWQNPGNGTETCWISGSTRSTRSTFNWQNPGNGTETPEPTPPWLVMPMPFNWQNPGNGTETLDYRKHHCRGSWLLSTDRILATGLKPVSRLSKKLWIFSLSTDRILATGLKQSTFYSVVA